MFYLLLVFAHLLAAATALGAIISTDLRMLAKLAQDRVRIAPPNPFVARLVTLSLLALYATGAGIVVMGLMDRPDYLSNPKLQAKLILVALLTLNAFALHRLTFPRLARGRSVARWQARDWFVIAIPVALSNFLWMFVTFLGIARPWNYSMPMAEIFAIAVGLYGVAQTAVVVVLVLAGQRAQADGKSIVNRVRRALAAVGNLGRPPAEMEKVKAKLPKHRGRPPLRLIGGTTAHGPLGDADTPGDEDGASRAARQRAAG